MSINISTSDYTQSKEVAIDGVDFKVRPMNSSESIALMNYARFANSIDKDTKDFDSVQEFVNEYKRIQDMYFNLFDKPEKARKILADLSFESLMAIYDKIMKGDK